MRVPVIITHILKHKLLSRKSSTRVSRKSSTCSKMEQMNSCEDSDEEMMDMLSLLLIMRRRRKRKNAKKKHRQNASILGQTYFSIEGATW